MARWKFGVFVALLGLMLGISVQTGAIAQDDQPSPTPRIGPGISALGLKSQTDSDDAEATIEALQTTVAEQATTIAELSDEPTPTPTAEAKAPQPPTDPVDLGSGIFLYSYLLVETESGPYLAVDLFNSSGSATLVPNLTVTYYDAEGSLLGDDSLFTFITWVDVDSHIPYSTSSVLDGAYDLTEIDRVEFSITPDTYHDYAEVDASNLEIVDVPLEGPDGAVNGRVKNNGDTPVEDVSIFYVVYDAEGIIVGECYTYLDVSIPPGKSAKFSISGSCGNIYSAEDYSIGGKPFTYRLLISL